MLNNHPRGDKKTEDHKNHDKVHENACQNQNNLEKLISSGKKYLSKTGKTLAFTGALTATTFIPGLINKALAETETVYKNNFEIPVYSEQYNPATKGIARDKENVLLKVEKDKDINELEITLKLEDFDKARENPSTGTFLNESFSTPVFVHSSNIDISEIRQKAYVNKGDDSYWTKLIPPEENKKLQRGIKLEKKILSKALKLGGFKLNDELKEHLERWWERFVKEQREKQREGFLKKAGEQEYKVTKISPFTHDKTSGRSMETARKFNISFEQEIPDKEELYMFQGIRLEKTIPTRASGSLKERLVIPFSIGEFSLWSLQEGEDFEWLQRGTYEQLRTSKKATDNHEVVSMLNYWDSGNERIFSFMRPVKKLDFDAKILIREDNKRPELIDRAKLYLPGITRIGDNSLNRTMFPLCEKDMDQENIDDPEWFIGVKLGEGKNEYKGKYIGEVSLDNSYK
ncbi:MAG: hypothetical protein ACOC1P_06215, partial [Minisyncoccales bacterium]